MAAVVAVAVVVGEGVVDGPPLRGRIAGGVDAVVRVLVAVGIDEQGKAQKRTPSRFT